MTRGIGKGFLLLYPAESGPLKAFRVVLLHQVVLALGLLPGETADIVAQVSANNTQIPAQKVLPADRQLSGGNIAKFQPRLLPVRLQHKPIGLPPLRHRQICPFTEGNQCLLPCQGLKKGQL